MEEIIFEIVQKSITAINTEWSEIKTTFEVDGKNSRRMSTYLKPRKDESVVGGYVNTEEDIWGIDNLDDLFIELLDCEHENKGFTRCLVHIVDDTDGIHYSVNYSSEPVEIWGRFQDSNWWPGNRPIEGGSPKWQTISYKELKRTIPELHLKPREWLKRWKWNDVTKRHEVRGN